MLQWKANSDSVWEGMLVEMLRKLIESMPRRIAACIAAGSGHKKY